MCALSSNRKAQKGLTLLEMVLFIVVIGVAGVIILTTLASPLTGAGTQTEAVTAAQVAQARMEVVLGQKRRQGFPGSDPCAGDPSLTFCQVPGDWSVNTGFEDWGSEDPDDYQVIVVTAEGPNGTSHTIRTLVARLGN